MISTRLIHSFNQSSLDSIKSELSAASESLPMISVLISDNFNSEGNFMLLSPFLEQSTCVCVVMCLGTITHFSSYDLILDKLQQVIIRVSFWCVMHKLVH